MGGSGDDTIFGNVDTLSPADPADPPSFDEVSSFTDPAAQDLWLRLMHPGEKPGPFAADMEPMTLGEVSDAIESIDRGMVADLTPAEADQLRQQLLGILRPAVEKGQATRANARAVERTGKVERGGPKIREPKPGAKPDAPPAVEWRPSTVPDDIAMLARELSGVVQKDPNLPHIEGYDGTQYVLTKTPKKGKLTGQPIAPRLFYGEDLISMADRIVPGLGEELLSGPRRKTFDARVNDHIIGRGIEMLVGGRPEHGIRAQALAHFKERLIGKSADLLSPEEYRAYEYDVKAIYRAWRHDQEMRTKVGIPLHRRIALIPARELDDIAEKALKERYDGKLPNWYVNSGVRPSEAWRFADNRLRNWLRGSGEGDLARFVDSYYDSGPVKALSAKARGFTALYHLYRFAMDLRWVALEMTEAPFIAGGRGGFGAVVEGTKAIIGKGEQAREPFLFGRRAQQAAREDWAHWMTVTDVGANMRLRDRYLTATLRREQPEALVRTMTDMARNDPELSSTLHKFGDTPEAWLQRLDRDWQALMAKSKPMTERGASDIWSPFLKDGTIDQGTFDRLVAAKRYTPVPAIEQAIAESAGDVRVQRLYRALEVKNNELWNDLASTFYGQADRSNLQRLLNHPLLYWPLSYQIKATKWLANILFDKALGVDTGSGGAWTIAQIHNDHVDRMKRDPEYAAYFTANKTLLFIAQMILPITPFDIGVSMSPWTRLVLSGQVADPQDETTAYSRNLFSVGPGYTFFSLLPRFLWEQGKPKAALSSLFGVGDAQGQGRGPLADLQRYAPMTIPVQPSKTSKMQNLDQQTVGNGNFGVDQAQLQLPTGVSRYGP